jgi:hypothetical protein
MSSPVNRTALREEENRSAPPSQAHNASEVIGPTPKMASLSVRAPLTCRDAASSDRRSRSRCSANVSIMDRAVLTWSRPTAESCSSTMDINRARELRITPDSPNAVVPW